MPAPRRSLPLSLCTWALLAALAACATPTAEVRAPPAAPPGWRHDWARGAVFYEIFVRSFQDSDGDGIGDLKGLTSRLDYLKSLGVEGLWLTPIFKSPSYHGYNTVDYETINPPYGTLEDFQTLLREAHKRNIRVLLDFVINHTGSDHPWFVESASSPTSPKRDWYLWRADDPGWTQPWGGNNHTWHEKNGAYFYGIFWGGMPDLNLRNPQVRAEIERLAKLWLDRGADGFRLDAARHLIETGPGQGQCDSPETHAFWKEFAAYVRSVKPDALLVGENWTETPIIATYYGSTAKVRGGDELPMNFDFPLAGAILESVNREDVELLSTKLDEIQRTYPAGVLDGTFLTNHDHTRAASQLGNDVAKMKSAAALLLTLPGTPFLYYGEEIGMQNGPGGKDEFKRMPMAWDGSATGGFTTGKPWFDLAPGHETANVAAEEKDPESLLAHYRRLAKVREGSKALREGTLQRLATNAGASVFAFTREAPGEKVVAVHNLGGGSVDVQVPVELQEALFTGAGVKAAKTASGWTVTLPGHASYVARTR